LQTKPHASFSSRDALSRSTYACENLHLSDIARYLHCKCATLFDNPWIKVISLNFFTLFDIFEMSLCVASDGSKYLFWSDAEQLKSIAGEIRSIRHDFGELNLTVERFLHCCSLRGSNVPGEPRLAKSLLDELESGPSRSQ
jgi:hypothetical protein